MVQSTINPRYEIDTDLSGLKELMPTLEMMPNMQVLNLANNKFGEQAAEYLLSSLNWDKTKLTVSRAVVTTRVTASIRSH